MDKSHKIIYVKRLYANELNNAIRVSCVLGSKRDHSIL